MSSVSLRECVCLLRRAMPLKQAALSLTQLPKPPPRGQHRGLIKLHMGRSRLFKTLVSHPPPPLSSSSHLLYSNHPNHLMSINHSASLECLGRSKVRTIANSLSPGYIVSRLLCLWQVCTTSVSSFTSGQSLVHDCHLTTKYRNRAFAEVSTQT